MKGHCVSVCFNIVCVIVLWWYHAAVTTYAFSAVRGGAAASVRTSAKRQLSKNLHTDNALTASRIAHGDNIHSINHNFTSTVLHWLDDVGIAWQPADHGILPLPYQQSHLCKSASFVHLPKSNILLHLCPTPTCVNEALPSTLNRQLTEWVCLNSTDHFTKIIHLHEDVWLAKNAIVKARLSVQAMAAAGTTTTTATKRIFARKTTVQKVKTATVARHFLTRNHLWGATKARYHYGLYYDDNDDNDNDKQLQLVAVATFSKCRKVLRGSNSTTTTPTLYHSYELIRYCSQRDATVVGGISKLLKQFVRDRKQEQQQQENNSNNNTTSTSIPMDIVTLVDRDWGPADGWQSMLCFESMCILDPLVMVVDGTTKVRRYLVGAGLDHRDDDDDEDVNAETLRRRQQSGLTPRLGLPTKLLNELNETAISANDAVRVLAKANLFPVYDAGVERLYLLVDPPRRPHRKESTATHAKSMATTLWQTAKPKYATRYYSGNNGIVALLEHAAIGLPPLDAPIHPQALQSWKNTSANDPSTTRLIYSASSSMDPNATIEVCERQGGWRTMRFVQEKSATTKVSSIYHGIWKVDSSSNNDNAPEPDIVIQEHLKTMGVLALMAGMDTDNDERSKYTKRYLHFGYGAGTLVRFLAHHAKDSQHVVVELDEAVVDAMSCCTPKMSNVTVITQDAVRYVREFKEQEGAARFDCICIDVFDECNFVPEQLYSFEILNRIRDNLLDNDGMLVWNFHSGGRRRTQVMENACKAVSTIFGTDSSYWIDSMDSTPTGGNSILVVTKRPLPEDGDGRICLSKLAVAAQVHYGLSFDATARILQVKRTGQSTG